MDSRSRPERPPAPYSHDAEAAVLGTMLQLGTYGGDARRVALAGLSADDFYVPAHGHVFEAIARLVDAGHIPDVGLVADQLRRDQLLEAVGGAIKLLELLNAAPAASGAPRWVQTVAELADQRREQAAALELAAAAAAGDDAGRARAREELERLAQQAGPRGRRPGSQPLVTGEAVLADLLEDFAHPEQAVSIATGIAALDRMLAGGGWRPGLFLLAAGPGVGKSAFALQSCLVAMAAGHPVLYVSAQYSRSCPQPQGMPGAAKLLPESDRVTWPVQSRPGSVSRDATIVLEHFFDWGSGAVRSHQHPATERPVQRESRPFVVRRREPKARPCR